MKFTQKITALFLALLMFSVYLPFTFAFDEESIDAYPAESNTDFAIKTAEIIKNENAPETMLRIIGKFRKVPSDDVFSLAIESVISEDGRFVLRFSSEKDLLSCLEDLNKNPNIIYAERDKLIYTESLKKGTGYLSWGVEAIEADIYAQSIVSSAENSVTVAIVDSGCEDIDFIKDKLVQGYDFFENDNNAFQDESVDGHGTFLASIVSDCVGNLPIRIMPIRVLDSKEGSLINVINGIRYAVDNGADVINLSLVAAMYNCKSLEDAVDYAKKNNVTVVVCAGNDANDINYYCPAHCKSALAVTSVNEDLTFSESFSNFGKGVDLAAPGENILGYNAVGQKVAMGGTSLSAAFVSAAAAMFVLDNPGCNNNQVREALISCAEDYGNTGWDSYYGWGIPKLGNLIKPPELKIRNNPGTKTINYGETLRLTAEITYRPENYSVWWYVDGNKTGEGETFEVAPANGRITVTAKLVDSYGNAVLNSQGYEVSDSETVMVNSGFFQKIISFFKNLFKINRNIIQTVFLKIT